ncbi:ABC transporter permease [Anatilimnocola floriformis]|uniref:ABC transporter permease n=1 Tax=Anatilimnocola floriformis TaxID=2948575 RepID=UPI0020C43945|nr:ABC transporter permease [Anatilimnocola floriformis]
MLLGPIFSRELALTPRRWQHYVYRVLYPAALAVLMSTAWFIVVGTQEIRNTGDMARFGSILLQVLAPLQLAVMTFLAALACVSSIAQEKDRKTMVLLLLTRLSDHEVVLGKLVSSLLPVFSMLLASFPIVGLITLFGGASWPQILVMYAIAFAAIFAAGSLGTLFALWREKTFQALTMTAIVISLWVGLWEAAALVAGETQVVSGTTISEITTAVSPFRATWSTLVNPSVTGVLPQQLLFVAVALGISLVLNAISTLRLRAWNTGRDAMPRNENAEDEAKTEEQARAGHVDARVRKVDQNSRPVWDNPVLWREMCTWAYGRKVLVMRVAYVLLFAAAAAGMWFTPRQVHGAEQAIVPSAARTLAPFLVVSLVIVNALAVTSITNERDGGALDLLLVTDLTPKEFVFGKLGGVAYVAKEMIALPIVLAILAFALGDMTFINLAMLLLGLGVMNVFVIMLGLHCGLHYANSRHAIGVSMGNVFFLCLGVVTLMLLMISFSGKFQGQIGPFLAFIVGGGVGIFVSLGIRNPSSAIGVTATVLPFATFFAVTSFLIGHWSDVFLVTCGAYGFAIAAMLIPAISGFDVALGRSRGANEE